MEAFGEPAMTRRPKGLRCADPAWPFTCGGTSYRGTEPTRFDQHIRVGSNTKVWVATVILQQVQEAPATRIAAALIGEIYASAP